jgi:antitoxin component YwqK of YwqJK toxin-antitoxin module
MKHFPALSLLLSSAFLLVSCGPPKEVDYRKLKYSDEVFFDPDTGKAFTGIGRMKYPDGKLQSEWPLKNGRYHGTVKEWYPNGKPKAETEFKNGQRSGKNVEWTEAGLLYMERIYDKDRIVSEKAHNAGK